MPRTFEKLDPSHKIVEHLGNMLRRHHRQLYEAEVTIDVLLVRNVSKDGEEIDPALSHNGYAAAATVKINSLSDRVEGKADATIKIDGNRWDEWPDARLDAILDHELTHLELKVDEEQPALVLRDDVGRPLLRMRKHDFQMGFFSEVAERHNQFAVETEQLQQVSQWATEHGWLPGFAP